jgi:hypothetical protein
MTLPASGAITLDQIQTEFGGSNPISLNEYYRGTGNVTNNNTSVPTSGEISMSDFYSGSVSTISYVGGLAVAYGGGGTSKTITINTLSGGLASSPSVGDLVILAWNVCTTANEPISATTAGWTNLFEVYNASSTGRGQDTNLSVAYKVWASGDSAVTFNVSASGNNASAAVIHVYRNVRCSGSTPELVTAVNSQANNSSATITPPNITTTTKNFLAVVIAAFGNNDSSALTAPGNLSNVFNINGNDYRDARIGVGTSAVISNAGTYSPSNWTMATATDRAPVSITIGMRPN